MKKVLNAFLLGALFSILPLSAQSRFSTQGHKGNVTAVFNENTSENAFFTAGQDGFLIRWTPDGLGEHFQLTEYEIRNACISPSGNEIAVYETDGGMINKISVWNWKNFTKKYSLTFKDTVLSLKYSKKGTYLIAALSSSESLVFINATTGKIEEKIKDATGIISWTETAASEKNVMLYSPVGSLSYYDMQTGKLLQKKNTEKGLSGLTLFAKNSFIAGLKDNELYVISALTGATVYKIKCGKPVISGADDTLYYLDGDEKMQSLYTIRVTEQGIKNPVIIKNIKANHSNLSTAIKYENTLIAGTTKGNVYKSDLSGAENPVASEPVSKTMYDNIIDMAYTNEDLYILTDKYIYKTSYQNEEMDKIPNTTGISKISVLDSKIIAWSTERKSPVYDVDFKTKKTQLLFTSENAIQSIRPYKSESLNGFVVLEGNSTVRFYSFLRKSLRELYFGAGIQDAMLYDDNNLYIAKVSSTKPESALLLVNTTTKETVPVKTTGNIAYSLTINKERYAPVQIAIEDKRTETSVEKTDDNASDSILNDQKLPVEQKKEPEAKEKLPQQVNSQGKTKAPAKKKKNPVKPVATVKPSVSSKPVETEKPVHTAAMQKPKSAVEQKKVSTAVQKIDGENSEKYIYGIIITGTAGESKTSVFAYNHQSQDFLNLIEKNSEDGNAFVSFIYPRIFTNVASSNIECTNLKTKKQFTLKRSASLPEKIVSGRDRIAVLNRDGSITWYNPDLPTPLADWYITEDGKIISF